MAIKREANIGLPFRHNSRYAKKILFFKPAKHNNCDLLTLTIFVLFLFILWNFFVKFFLTFMTFT